MQRGGTVTIYICLSNQYCTTYVFGIILGANREPFFRVKRGCCGIFNWSAFNDIISIQILEKKLAKSTWKSL